MTVGCVPCEINAENLIRQRDHAISKGEIAFSGSETADRGLFVGKGLVPVRGNSLYYNVIKQERKVNI